MINNDFSIMLTTNDNPFNPFIQFVEWFAYDASMNYNSCSLLARVVKTSEELSDLDEEHAIETAIDEIIKFDVFGIYKKVTPDDFSPPKKLND